MSGELELALSFFPTSGVDFTIPVFTRLMLEGEAKPISDCRLRRLPNADSSQYEQFWVSFTNTEGFDSRTVGMYDNINLTTAYLQHLLVERSSACLTIAEYRLSRKKFDARVSYVLEETTNGSMTVRLQSYYLPCSKRFGFLADIHFELGENEVMSAAVLEHSLAQKNGRPNVDFYSDRLDRIKLFISDFHSRLFPLLPPGNTPIPVSPKLQRLPASTLQAKQYTFIDNQKESSPFRGLKSFGPVKQLPTGARLAFIFQNADRHLSQDLFRALRGDTYATFGGMTSMFGVDLSNASVEGIGVNDCSIQSLEGACERLNAISSPSHRTLPIFLAPFAKGEGDEASDHYFRAKHCFLKSGFPSQFVARKTLLNKDQLKWSLSNIGLQIFAKLGGQPWRVQPATRDCLIIGLGQAHRMEPAGISRYLAYSVLSDSSGLYENIRVLARDTDETRYLQDLKENLSQVIREHLATFNTFVLHSTFSIRHDELLAVNDVLSALASSTPGKHFVAMKFNERNKFFAYATYNNSFVPREGTLLRLADSEFLAWFEGAKSLLSSSAEQPTRPTHVKFLYPRDQISTDERIRYLQDSMNLSGANWRGFRARSLPISIYYASLIANYYREFDSRGLGEIDLNSVELPWFL